MCCWYFSLWSEIHHSIAAALQLQGKMKYFCMSGYLMQLWTSSTMALGTAKQLLKLSGKVGTNRENWLNLTKSLFSNEKLYQFI